MRFTLFLKLFFMFMLKSRETAESDRTDFRMGFRKSIENQRTDFGLSLDSGFENQRMRTYTDSVYVCLYTHIYIYMLVILYINILNIKHYLLF